MNSYEWHYTKECHYFVYGNCWQLFEGLSRFLISRVGSKSEIKNRPLCLFVSCVTRLKNSSLEKNWENLHWGIVWVTAFQFQGFCFYWSFIGLNPCGYCFSGLICFGGSLNVCNIIIVMVLFTITWFFIFTIRFNYALFSLQSNYLFFKVVLGIFKGCVFFMSQITIV